MRHIIDLLERLLLVTERIAQALETIARDQGPVVGNVGFSYRQQQYVTPLDGANIDQGQGERPQSDPMVRVGMRGLRG